MTVGFAFRWALRSALLLLLALFGPITAGTALAGDCAPEARAGWSETEADAWAVLARGEVFDAEAYAPEGPQRRVLRPQVLRAFLTCPTLAGALGQRGVALKGAVVPGVLDLALADVLVRFSCSDCFLAGISAPNAHWHEALVLDRSKVRGALDFDLARFDGEFQAWDLRAGKDLTFNEATVGRGLDLRGLGATGSLKMRNATVGARLRLDGARLAALDLGGSKIGGQAILSGIRIDGRAVLDGMAIGDDLLLRSYEDGPNPVIGAAFDATQVARMNARGESVLNLNNSHIAGRLEIAEATLNGPLSLDAVRVGEDIWLRDCSRVAGPITMPFARIGQNLDFSTTRLHSIDATGSKIQGELRLGAMGSARLTAPVWSEAAEFVLRNVSVAAWVDAADSPANGTSAGRKTCPPPGAEQGANGVEHGRDPWPPRIDVIGFSYDRAGGLGRGVEAQRAESWYVDWLARQQPFSLDPYGRLARFLSDNGREAAADEVRYAGKERQLAESVGLPKTLLFLQKIFVGYGIHTWYVLAWVIGLVLLGSLVFARSPEAKASRMPYCLAYSTEMLLPFVRLRRLHGDVEFAGPTRYYLYLHKFMGWVCGLFFVSALAGLFKV